MFNGAGVFNRDISIWNVGSVTTMKRMFLNAYVFDIDISEWDVSRVTSMESMFRNAEKFSHTLCGAWFVSTAEKDRLFERSEGKMCLCEYLRITVSVSVLAQCYVYTHVCLYLSISCF